VTRDSRPGGGHGTPRAVTADSRPRCTIAEKRREGVCLNGWLLSVTLGHLIHARDLLAVLLGGLVAGVIGTMLDAIADATPPILDRPHEPGEER
jgi:hypothetical protein